MASGDFLNGPLPSKGSALRTRLDEMPKTLKELRSQHDIDNVRYLNCGGFGIVYSAEDKHKNQFALKVIQTQYLSSQGLEEWADTNKSELYYLSRLRHHNIVQFYGEIWFHTPVPFNGGQVISMKPNCLLIKTELLRTSLSDVFDLGPMPKRVMRYMTRQMASALNYMHALGIAHHDLKQPNVMIVEAIPKSGRWVDLEEQLSRCTLKIIDLGLCRRYPVELGRNVVERDFHRGTSLYLSREKSEKRPYNPYLADSYSLGVMMFWAMLGTPQLQSLLGENAVLDPVEARTKLLELIKKFMYRWYQKEPNLANVPIMDQTIIGLLAPEKRRLFAGDVVDALDQFQEVEFEEIDLI